MADEPQEHFAESILRLVETERKLTRIIIADPATVIIQQLYKSITERLRAIETSLLVDDDWEAWWEECVVKYNSPGLAYNTSERDNSIDYLRQARDSLRVESDYRWKHVILGLHGCLYGFSITILGSSNPDRVLTKPDKKGRQHLIPFPEAIKRVFHPKGRYLLNGITLTISEEEKESIDQLNDKLRNNFIHFPPMGWSIMLDGLPLLCLRLLNPIFSIAFTGVTLYRAIDRLQVWHYLREMADLLILEHAKIHLIYAKNSQDQEGTE